MFKYVAKPSRLTAFGSLRKFATGANVVSLPALRDVSGTPLNMSDKFKKRKVVVVGVVGAFTGTCTNKHVPSYIEAVGDLKAKGIDEVVVVTVNDHLVAKAWADEMGVKDEVTILADSDASFTKSLGLDIDLSAAGLGVRSKRYSLIVDDGVITQETVANNPGEVEQTGADNILATLK